MPIELQYAVRVSHTIQLQTPTSPLQDMMARRGGFVGEVLYHLHLEPVHDGHGAGERVSHHNGLTTHKEVQQILAIGS